MDHSKLLKYYQIECALTTCSLGIPMGLRKESQLGKAISNIEELIEQEIQEQIENGVALDAIELNVKKQE